MKSTHIFSDAEAIDALYRLHKHTIAEQDMVIAHDTTKESQFFYA